MSVARNRYDRGEWAGAFGDLGTLLPFVIAYVSVVKLDPFGVLFGFGVSMLACGWFYRTPFPVQPMKLVGAVAAAPAAQSVAISQGAVYGAGLVTGLFWLLLGATGLAQRIAGWIARPVAQGVVLGVAIALMVQGGRLVAVDWLLGAAGIAVVVLLARSRRVPAIFALLLLGVAWAVFQQPALIDDLRGIRPALRLPALAWPSIGWDDLVAGTLLLAIPQVPLTLGNAIVGVRAENNRLFPDRPVTDRGVAVSTGAMNLLGSAVGGVPMCHGAGGMAAHVAFGARTGGSLVILGALLLVLALGFASSVLTLFRLVPPALLGTILLVAGLHLARGQFTGLGGARTWTVLAVTAGVSAWNAAIGFGVGLLLQLLVLRGGADR